MRRIITGWFLAVTGFLACPCHLVITLPLAAALLGGTAVGGWIAGHEGAIFIGASIYFISVLAAGATLLLASTGALASTAGQRQAASSDCARSLVGADCCAPSRFPAAATDHILDDAVDTTQAGRTTGAEARRQESEEAGTPSSRWASPALQAHDVGEHGGQAIAGRGDDYHDALIPPTFTVLTARMGPSGLQAHSTPAVRAAARPYLVLGAAGGRAGPRPAGRATGAGTRPRRGPDSKPPRASPPHPQFSDRVCRCSHTAR